MLRLQHIAAALPLLLAPACGRGTHSSGQAGESATRILQFYAAPGEITAGEQASLCYGVENARAVRIEPEVEKLRPALSRCFPVSPAQDAEYTLLVEGADGQRLSKSARVIVKPPVPPEPKILVFTGSARQVTRGQPVTLCFEAENAASLRLEPPVQPLGKATRGCFSLFPRETTTYTLIAAGASKQADRRKVTVTVQ